MIPFVPHPKVEFWRIAIQPWLLFHYFIAWGFGVFYALREFIRRKDVDVDVFLQSLVVGFAGSVIGSRVFSFFGTWSIPYGTEGFTLSNRIWAMLSAANTGWVAYGGLVGGLLAGYLYLAIKKVDVRKYFNVFIPGVPLGMAIARIGCFLAGSCFGSVTKLKLPWIVNFGGYAIHPTQLYNTLTNLAIFITLIWLYDKGLKQGKERNLFFYYAGMYSVLRFMTELVRGDYAPSNYFFGLSSSQVISVIALVVVIIYFIIKKPDEKLKAKTAPLNISRKTYLTIIIGMLIVTMATLFISTKFWISSIAFITFGLLITLYGINSIFPPLGKTVKDILKANKSKN